MIALLIGSSATAVSFEFLACPSLAPPVTGVRMSELSHASCLNARARDFVAQAPCGEEIHCQSP